MKFGFQIWDQHSAPSCIGVAKRVHSEKALVLLRTAQNVCIPRMVDISGPLPSLLAIPARSKGHFVRCLGWDNLCLPLSAVSGAITSSLAVLEVPYEVVAARSDGLGYAFVVDARQPAAGSLCVSIIVHAAEHGCTSRHHVSLRRIMGECWQLQAFYAAFRKTLSANLGFADAAALADYSPLQERHPFDAARTAGCMSAQGRFHAEPAIMPPYLMAVNAAAANCGGAAAAPAAGVTYHAVDMAIAHEGGDYENCDVVTRLMSPASADHAATPSAAVAARAAVPSAASQRAAEPPPSSCAARSPARPR